MATAALVIHSPVRATLSLLLCAFCLIAVTALTGSSDAVDPLNIQDQLAISSGELTAHAIGQTFTFHLPRLHTIQVAWIVSTDFQFQRDARVTLHLRTNPNDTRDLAFTSIPLGEIQNNSFSEFTFSPLSDSKDKTYYFFFTLPRDAITRGSFALWSSADDSYPEGTLQVNGAPTDRDLAFRAYYAPDLGMLADALARTLAQFGASMFFAVAVLLGTLWVATRHSPRIFSLALALGGLLAFVVALLQIRDLGAPLWVDSFTHAQHVQFILEHARLPTENFYHLGYHIITALAARLFDLSIPQALLLAGQFIWVLVGAAVFVLSRKISGGALAGLVAALCIWFLSPTPVYFITWGRYPLVLGAAILPVAMLCAIQLIDAPHASRRSILLTAISFAALAFSQIRLTAFYAAFVAIYFLVRNLTPRVMGLGLRFCLYLPPVREEGDGGSHSTKHLGIHKSNEHLLETTRPFASLRVTIAIFVAFILLVAFLWLGALWANGLGFEKIIAQNKSQPSIDLSTAMDVAVAHHGPELWFLAALAVVVGIARRSHVTFLMLGWFIAVGIITLFPPVIGELVPPSLVVLMVFLPAALVVGDAAQLAYERWSAPNRIVRAVAWAVTLVSISLIGAQDMVSVANPATILFTPADENAMQWIKVNVPVHSRFLVNSFNWVGPAFVPSDGGGWIPYFTDNSTEYIKASAMKSASESTLLRWIESQKINYIYLGTRAGILYSTDFLSQPERFALIYNREGVRIFRAKAGTGN